MIARTRYHQQEHWYHDVTRAIGDGRYISLHIAAHPSLVHYWRSAVLLAATGEDMTAMLREEAHDGVSR